MKKGFNGNKTKIINKSRDGLVNATRVKNFAQPWCPKISELVPQGDRGVVNFLAAKKLPSMQLHTDVFRRCTNLKTSTGPRRSGAEDVSVS